MKNLLTFEEQQKIRHTYWLRLMAVSTFIIAAIIVLAALFLVPPYILATTTINGLEDQLASLERQEEIGGGNDTRRLLVETLDHMKFAQYTRTLLSPSDLVGLVLDQKSDQIEVSALSMTETEAGYQLVMQGLSASRSDLVEYKERLESIERVASVVLPLRDLTRSEELQFTLTLEVRAD